MKTASPFLAWTTLVCLVLAAVAGNSAAGMAGRQKLGQPLDGLSMQERKQFRDGKQAFSEVEDADDGLGPIFNNNSCVACHSVPAVGGSSPLNETRAQRVDGLGAHFEFEGGSLFQSGAIHPRGAEVVPPGANAIGLRQTIHGETVDAFSDLLLHDVGTGDNIVQGGAAANELRTTPLWGVSESGPYLHDGAAPTIHHAILRHANQGAAAQRAYRALTGGDRQALLAFLGSL